MEFITAAMRAGKTLAQENLAKELEKNGEVVYRCVEGIALPKGTKLITSTQEFKLTSTPIGMPINTLSISPDMSLAFQDTEAVDLMVTYLLSVKFFMQQSPTCPFCGNSRLLVSGRLIKCPDCCRDILIPTKEDSKNEHSR